MVGIIMGDRRTAVPRSNVRCTTPTKRARGQAFWSAKASGRFEYLTIWPSWALPIQTQPFSRGFMWACNGGRGDGESSQRYASGRIHRVHQQRALPQPGHARVVGNGDPGASSGMACRSTLSQDAAHPGSTSSAPTRFWTPARWRSAPMRMETCAQVIRDVTRAYGVDTSMDLWLPGDPQPDSGAQPAHLRVSPGPTAARSPARPKRSKTP